MRRPSSRQELLDVARSRRAGSTSPTSVRIDAARHERRALQRPHLLRGRRRRRPRPGRHLPRDRVVAEPLALQRLPRDRARLGPGHRDPLDEPVALAGDLGVGVRGGGEHVGEHVQHVGRPAASPEPETSSRSGSTADAEVGADRGQLVVDRDAVAGRGAGEQGLGEQLGDGRVLGRVPRERHPQPQLDHRDARAVRGEHPQAVGQRDVDHVRQRDLAGGAERRAAGGGRRRCGRSPRRCGARVVTVRSRLLLAGLRDGLDGSARARRLPAQRRGGGPHLLGGDGGQPVRQLGARSRRVRRAARGRRGPASGTSRGRSPGSSAADQRATWRASSSSVGPSAASLSSSSSSAPSTRSGSTAARVHRGDRERVGVARVERPHQARARGDVGDQAVDVHEAALQPGGLAVAEHRAEQRVAEVAVEVGGRVGQPVADGERGQRGVRVGHGLAALGARRRLGERRAGRASARAGMSPKCFSTSAQRLVDVEVAGDRDLRVARRVVGVEERRGVVEGGLLQLGEVAVAVVRVGERVEEDRRQQDPGEPAVGPVEDVEPDLLLDDVDLVAQVLLGERRARASGRPPGTAPAPARRRAAPRSSRCSPGGWSR